MAEKRRAVAIKELKEKLREETVEELRSKEQELCDQLFRLKFQLASGQSDTLRKIRELKKDIARVKTIRRERTERAAKL
jgi:large subunit ribosomal protein L29